MGRAMWRRDSGGAPLPDDSKEDRAGEDLGEGGRERGAAGAHVEAEHKQHVHEEVADVGDEHGV